MVAVTAAEVSKQTIEEEPENKLTKAKSIDDGGGGDLNKNILPEEIIAIKIRGVDNGDKSPLFICTPSLTLGDLFNQVSTKFSISQEGFELVYQDAASGTIYSLSKLPSDAVLSAINIFPSKIKEYSISIEAKKASRKKISRKLDDLYNSINDKAAPSPTDDSKASSSCNEFIFSVKDFVGLKNKSMTCYLNSLLQSLWFTPEFRNAVCQFVNEKDAEKMRSISVGLQGMFLQLQFSIRDSLDTEELTSTFGWKHEEFWTQQDIEELYRIIMEHLSEEYKGTPLDGIINALYAGIFYDYVECLECKNRNQKTELFLALPLPLRNLKTGVIESTLEGAFNSFIAPELLNENNQYNCSICNKKTDAHKGLSFKELPYILCIQLKRFEYDPERFQRKKLNHKISFPQILNMNHLVDSYESKESATTKSEGSSENETKIPKLNPEIIHGGCSSSKRDSHSRPSIDLNNFTFSKPNMENGETETKTEPSSVPECFAEDIKLALENGPNVYQLYAILIHYGSGSGGHYFAYIMDFETWQWYRFDDTFVRRINTDEISGTFGGDTIESGSAYMLMYRRIDPAMNALPLLKKDMPSHMIEMLERLSREDKETHVKEEFDKNTVKLHVFYSPTNCITQLIDKEISIDKTKTFGETIMECYKSFCPEGEIKPELIRLVRYDCDLRVIENNFDGVLEEPIRKALKNPPPETKNEGFLLEIKEESEEFETFSCKDAVFVTHQMSSESEDVVKTKEIHIKEDETFTHLKDKIKKLFQIDPESDISMVIQQSSSNSHFNSVRDFNAEITHCCPERVNVAYFEPKIQENEFHTLVSNFLNSFTFEVELEIVQNEKENETGGKCNGELKVEEENNTIKKEESESVKYFRILTAETVSEENKSKKMMNCRGHKQLALYDLSSLLQPNIGVEEKDFVLYRTINGEDVEIANFCSALHHQLPFDKLKAKIGHRLQKGEFRVPIYSFQLDKLTDKPEYLGEMILNEKMTVEETKKMILSDKNMQLNGINPEKCYRIRIKRESNPSEILRDHDKLRFLANPHEDKELFLQEIAVVDPEDRHYSILIRHWHPSNLVLDPPKEILMEQDLTKSTEERVFDAVVANFSIEMENLEIGKPDCPYPCNLNPLYLQERLEWNTLSSIGTKRIFFIARDELLIIVRDAKESFKELSPEERRTFQKDLNSKSDLYEFTPIRREQALKINLLMSPKI